MTTTITVSPGTTDTISGDADTQTLEVSGGGTLEIGHDAISTTIDATNVSVTIDTDFGSGLADFINSTLYVKHNTEYSRTDASNSSIRVGNDFDYSSADLTNSTLIAGYDANNSDFVLNDSTAELPCSYTDTSFVLQGTNDEIVLGLTPEWTVKGTTLSSGLTGLTNPISGFGTGDKIELAGLTFDGASLGGQTLTLTEKGAPVFQLTDFSLAPGASNQFTFGYDPSNGNDYVQAACYAAGTRILTVRGEVAVEDLREGDRVVTLSGKSAPVRWIGWRDVDVATHPHPDLVRPIRIRAGAFRDGQPRRDLTVSPDHALFVDGVLINAARLVNGVSILQDMGVGVVRYFHVELKAHDILLADGVPAESYLDTGNRAHFANGAGMVALHSHLPPKRMQTDACAALVEDGPVLAAVRRRLIERVAAQGYVVSREPELHLVVNGQAVRPAAVHGMTYRFDLPNQVRELRIVSRGFVPSGVTPANPDMRRLGVCLGGIVLRAGGATRPVAIDDPALGRGFHPVEGDGAAEWRWTDGNARLPSALLGDLSGDANLELHLLWPGSYLVRSETTGAERLTA